MSDTQAILESLKEDVRAVSDTVDVVAEVSRKHARQLAVMGKRLDRIEIRMVEHDQRFDQIDQRFNQVDQRFNQVDQRFNQVDQRFDSVGGELQTIRAQLTEVLARLAS
jgi:chromosome segregation ATPase